jgi:hypothetical protein
MEDLRSFGGYLDSGVFDDGDFSIVADPRQSGLLNGLRGGVGTWAICWSSAVMAAILRSSAKM